MRAVEGLKVVEGVDLRKPEYRRDSFHYFYEFQLRTKGHAGCVYFIFPYLFERLNMNEEEQLWMMFINGNTQNPITTYQIFTQFRDVLNLDMDLFKAWFEKERPRLQWDTDRRYLRTQFIGAVEKYKTLLNEGTQRELFDGVYGDAVNKHERFRRLWDFVMENFDTFARLSTFSYLEYLFVKGESLDCDQLFLDNIKGSKSHRNGICKIIGRDDWEWTKTNEVDYSGKIDYLASEAELLLNEAKDIHNHPDTSYFTLETALCTYKSSYRLNRRYPGVYIDMMYDRIKTAEKRFREQDFKVFWDCREACLPEWILREKSGDMGVCSEKQNHFRDTGEIVMMEHMFPLFKSSYTGETNINQLKLF